MTGVSATSCLGTLLLGCTLAACSGDFVAGARGAGGLGAGATSGAAGLPASGGTSAGGMGVTAGTPSSGGGSTGPGGQVGAGGSGGRASGTGGRDVAGGSAGMGSGGTPNGGAPSGGMSNGGASNGGMPNGGNAASGGAPGSGGADSCGIPRYDASKPPTTLALTGNLGTHDPAVILADGVYYQFATGNGIGTKRSNDLLAWTGTPDVFSQIPSWVGSRVSGVTNIWAPDISFFGGKYHLYYAVSTFGSNKSCIGHATRDSLSSGSWSDHGAVFCSNVGTSDDFNAIDPNVIVDEAGTPWLDFGSFWSGIKLIKLDTTGNRDGTEIASIASHSSIEGPFIIHQCGYYYLFISWGSCCGSPWDYNIRVGRSKNVKGPYLDKAGTDLMKNGGTLIVQGNATVTAPGHNAVIVTPKGAYNVYHALDANHGNARLRISELVLDADGWPISGGP